MKKIFTASFFVILSGCSLVNQHKMQQSQDAYINCLREFHGDQKSCAIEKVQYEADKNTFEHTGSGIMGTGNPNVYTPSNQSIAQPTIPQPQQWMVNQDGRSYMCNNYGGTVNCN